MAAGGGPIGPSRGTQVTLAISTPLRHKTGPRRPPGRPIGRGCSSAVEHHVANVRVEGSIPFARSNFLAVSRETRVATAP